MIAKVEIIEKSYGDKTLYNGLSFELQAGEKVGLIGRNGTGKTTLFNILTESDNDYAGEIEFKTGLIRVSSRQEHHGYENVPVLEYILNDLPKYTELKSILDNYPNKMDSTKKMNAFSDALEQFNALGYFRVEEEIVRSLEAYQLNPVQINGKLAKLSGGQKRFVELVKVQHSHAGLTLIDEPTNHMDYINKAVFLEWFKAKKEAVVVITHDRNVLKAVDRIIEIRDGKAYSFPGNYDDYLKINAVKVVSQVNEYGINQQRISNLKEDIVRFRRLKEKSRNPGSIRRFKLLEIKSQNELEKLQTHDKPSFWIDRESASNLNKKMNVAYDEHKARNIKLRLKSGNVSSSRVLIEVDKLSLGYDKPLFFDLSFQLREGQRLKLHGRNGSGKSTLVKAILANANNTQAESKQFAGKIIVEPKVKIGVYEQEIDKKYLTMSLHDAIESACHDKGLYLSDQKIKQLLSDYLFDPRSDGGLVLTKLSGGQKARFQLIQMLADEPQILILDEPTNHLDLPSIEELEDSLSRYFGAIIYISHDSYFAKNIGGRTLSIDQIQIPEV